MAGSPLASPRRAGWIDYPACALTEWSLRRSFHLRTNVCGDVQRNHLFFSPARLADKRAPEPPSCQSPLPEARFLASGLHPSTCVPWIFLQRCSMGFCLFCFAIKGFIAKPHVGLTGAIPKMSGTGNAVARSTPRIQQFVLALSTSSRQGVQRKNVRPVFILKPLAVSTSILNSEF